MIASLPKMMLTSILEGDPDIKVVTTASNGREAVGLVPRVKPDLITMDIHMPVIDGLKATEQIIAYHPTSNAYSDRQHTGQVTDEPGFQSNICRGPGYDREARP